MWRRVTIFCLLEQPSVISTIKGKVMSLILCLSVYLTSVKFLNGMVAHPVCNWLFRKLCGYGWATRTEQIMNVFLIKSCSQILCDISCRHNNRGMRANKKIEECVQPIRRRQWSWLNQTPSRASFGNELNSWFNRLQPLNFLKQELKVSSIK